MLAAWILALLAPASAPPADATDLYDRVVERAIRSARVELLGSRHLVVDHSTWQDPWVVQSQHYEVRTTRGYALGQRIANGLEYMLTQYRSLLDTDYAPPQRFPIWILPTLQDYTNVGQSADEHSSFYGSYFATDQPGQPVATYYLPNEKLLGMWVTHSATHQFVQQAFGTTPPAWVSEGLAGYFALYWDWEWASRRLKELVTSRQDVRPSRLMDATLASFTNDPEERLLVLGMFFKYLLHHHPDTRLAAGGEAEPDTSFARYLREVVRGRSGVNTGFAAYLDDELDLLEAQFRGFDFGG